MTSPNYLVTIVGPTAVGKSHLALKLAKVYQSDIVSADSRQFYRELNIGTAKPSEAELNEVKHHFINSHSIHDYYNAGMYEREAVELLSNLFQKKRLVILVGGSGMYIDALLKGFSPVPEVPQEIRDKYNQLKTEKGLEYLATLLKEKDEDYFALVDKSNGQRVIRALEVIEFTGKPFSSYLNAEPKVMRDFSPVKIGLTLPREVLYERIDRRMDDMIAHGLFDEAGSLSQFRNLYALQTVGYSEIFDFLEGKYEKEEAIRLLKRNSRRYAKRQLTWFKKDPEIEWFSPDQFAEIKEHIGSMIRKEASPE